MERGMGQGDHRRFEEDLAAYLLDALDADEVREFRAHLEGCARCQHDERWLRAAAEQLPSSVEQLEPPRQLRNRLMARVHVEAKNDSASARETPRRRWRWPVVRTAAAAAAIAIAIFGPLGYLLGNDEETKTTTVQAEATKASSIAQANLVRKDDSGVLKVAMLPVQRRGHVYQTWLQRGKQIVPSTLFVVNNDGSGSAVVENLDGVDAVMVSEEPDGGSPQPTSSPVLIAKL
jgi:anti-sigma-K factor RskA